MLGVRDTMMKKTEHLRSRGRGGETAVNRSFQSHNYVKSVLTGVMIRNTEEELIINRLGKSGHRTPSGQIGASK